MLALRNLSVVDHLYLLPPLFLLLLFIVITENDRLADLDHSFLLDLFVLDDLAVLVQQNREVSAGKLFPPPDSGGR